MPMNVSGKIIAGSTLPRILRKIGHREWRVVSWGPCCRLSAQEVGHGGFPHTYKISVDKITFGTAVRLTVAEGYVVLHFVMGTVVTCGE